MPFCSPGKCRYCDFYSEPRDERLEALYVQALRREAELAGAGVVPATIYIGGGTPTSLSALSLAMLFEALSLFPAQRLEEFSIEANPGTLDAEKACMLRERGVNRISIGAQSFDDRVLRFLGRSHRPGDTVSAVETARRAGFRNLSLDLMSDVPGTTREHWLSELKRAVELEPEHISVYSLTLEPGTPLNASLKAGEFETLEEDEAAERMAVTAEFLESKGYGRYEISNYALAGFECKHNRLYWRNAPVLGLGPSAVSFDGRLRRRNVPDVKGYVRALDAGKLPVTFGERLEPRRLAGETAMLMLRRREGIVRSEFLEATGMDPFQVFAETITRLEAAGVLVREVESVRIPPEKAAIADSIAVEFIEPGGEE